MPNIRERQRSYKDVVQARFADNGTARFADAFGFSNSAKVVERGLFAFNANFNALAADANALIIHCLLRFPPEDEVYFSLVIRRDLQVLRERLEQMQAEGMSRPRGAGRDESEDNDEEDADGGTLAAASPEGLTYTNNSKNVKGFIARDGKLYLRNKGYWDSMPEDPGIIRLPVEIDEVVFAIWPPAASARRSLLARQFVGYIGKLVGPEKVHELQVWTDTGAVLPSMCRMPPAIPVADIEAAIQALGGHYPNGEIRRFHAALNFSARKHFVILSGLSGTGKTQLAIQYAHAVHGLGKTDADPFLFICPVRPEWTDPTGLTGYFDVLSGQYVVPRFLEALLLATAHRETPVFVVLDEMNLARVEYYFSDLLSALETGAEVTLHLDDVPKEGPAGTAIPSSLPVPENLFIIGTINIDETTNAVSDKVLDRAMVIDMSAVDLSGFLQALGTRDASLADARTACEPLLVAAHTLMQSHGLGFGYRVAEEVLRYHTFARMHLGQASDAILDDLLVQKILVKLRGAARQRPLLTGLLTALPLPRTQALLTRLTEDLDEFGSFQASR